METSDPKYKHKPSEKHTLEEVLKSLQDLIRNDLAEGGANAAKPETGDSRLADGGIRAAETQSSREKISALREDFAPVSPAAGPVNLDAVMRSLKDLIGNELNVGDPPKSENPPPASKHDEYLSAADDIEEYLPQEYAPLEDESIPGEETESTLEQLADNTDSAPAPSEPEAPEPGDSGSPELANDFGAPTAMDQTAENDLAPGTQHELFFDEPPPPETELEEITLGAPDEPADFPAPDAPADEAMPSPTLEELADNADSALPTIEVEESFGSAAYPETTDAAAEIPPPEPEEIMALDVGIADDAASPAAGAPETPAGEEKESIALEIVDEPDAGSKTPVDFDSFDVAETAPESEAPPFTIEPAAEIPRETAAEAKTATEAKAQPPVEAPAAAESSFSLDDIPVLNEVVAPPAGALPANSHIPPAALPSPDRARDIVVRAVAKLNIEMRKSGSAGLDTRTILRLQQLIRQELEKVGEK